jgi:hypothetical protein
MSWPISLLLRFFPNSRIARLLLPRIEYWHPGFVEIAPVAGDHSQAMFEGRGREHQIGMRIGMSDLSTLFHQPSPSVQYVFCHGQNPSSSEGDIPYIGEAYARRGQVDLRVRPRL